LESRASYTALKSRIEAITEGPERNYAVQQIEALGQEPFIEDPESGPRWRQLNTESQLSAALNYPEELARLLITTGCGVDGATNVIAGVLEQLDDRLEDNPAQRAKVATAFLDEANCPGARGLSRQNKTKLRQMRDAEPAQPSAGAASR
jgi:hypothetical protein